MKKTHLFGLLLSVVLMALSLLLIIGVDTNWGKTEVTKLNLASGDGDQISALMYRPKAATADNQLLSSYMPMAVQICLNRDLPMLLSLHAGDM